jgi:hypothetical protein
VNQLLLLLSAAAMIGAAIYNGHQALMLRGINKRLAGVVKNLETDTRAIAELSTALREAETACDEWERKNGDAPHRCVKLADRIRVNAGLYP